MFALCDAVQLVRCDCPLARAHQVSFGAGIAQAAAPQTSQGGEGQHPIQKKKAQECTKTYTPALIKINRHTKTYLFEWTAVAPLVLGLWP